MLKCGLISEYRDFSYQQVKMEHGQGGMIRAATEVVVDFQPDLLVYITSWAKDDLPAKLLEGFEAAGCKVLTIAWDTFPGASPASYRQNLWFGATSYFCDVCSFVSYARFRFWQEELHPEKGVIYLSGNNVLSERFVKQDKTKDIDVSLIGSLYGVRRELLKFLQENLSSQNITVSHFGGHFDDGEKMPDQGAATNWLTHEDYIDIINRSKIVLCPSGTEGQWAVRGKIFEFMSCGAFCLAERNTDISLTIPSESLVTYQSQEECLQHIQYYLTHEQERETFAAHSKDWYFANYNTNKFWTDFLVGVATGQNNFTNTEFVEYNYQKVRRGLLEYFDGETPTPDAIMALNISE